MNLETEAYRKFTGPAEHYKAVNSFLGLLEGISIDGVIDEKEVQELKNWYDLYRPFIDRHPFNEILPAVEEALADNILTYDEVDALRWLCHNVDSRMYYDIATSSIQTLHGVLHGILANNAVTDEELNGLHKWLQLHFLLKGTYPFDEIYSLLSAILADGIVTDDERNILKAFFSEFIDTRDSYNLNEKELAELRERYSVSGVCAKDPSIIFDGNLFCFTGASARAKRNDIEALIYDRGGSCSGNVTKKTQYLIVGAEGNPCWAFSCYGRKIEKAVELRKNGLPIIIVNEHDFWSALEM